MAKIILENTPEGGHISIDSEDFDRVLYPIDHPGKTLRQLILEDSADAMGWKRYSKGGKKENISVVRRLARPGVSQ